MIIRIRAISDLYFSSEAYDTYGPEHGTYLDHVQLQMPDTRDWEIVEGLEHGDDLEEFNDADVRRVQRMIMITDEQYAQLVADGEDAADDGMIRLPAEGRHRIAFINKEALDYISIPTHKYEAGSVEASADAIEGTEQ